MTVIFTNRLNRVKAIIREKGLKLNRENIVGILIPTSTLIPFLKSLVILKNISP